MVNVVGLDLELSWLWWTMTALFVGICLAIYIIVVLLRAWMNERRLRKRSPYHYGASVNQFIPLTKNYPWDLSGFRFLGSPVTGIQFNEDEIIFVEFIFSNPPENRHEYPLRQLVQDGRIKFKLINVAGV